MRVTFPFFVLLACGLITGCSLYDVPGYDAFRPVAPTFTNVPVPTSTVVTPTPVCAFVENRHPMQEVTDRLLTDFKAAALPLDTIAVDALGSDCIDPSTNKRLGFKPIQIDVQLVLSVPDIVDRGNLGGILAKILRICESYAEGDLKGARSGEVFITFVSGSLQTDLRFTLDEGIKALHQGLTGESLLNWLDSR